MEFEMAKKQRLCGDRPLVAGGERSEPNGGKWARPKFYKL